MLIPQAVQHELADERCRLPRDARRVVGRLAPSTLDYIMQAWISQSSEWLVIQAVEVPSDSDLDNLDLGERATIVLAVARGENLVILDDLLGKQVALVCYLRVIGLVGVLDEAARQNLVDFSGAIARLQRTTLRVSLKLIQSLLQHQSEDKL